MFLVLNKTKCSARFLNYVPLFNFEKQTVNRSEFNALNMHYSHKGIDGNQ